ncbi:MAG: ABC transporter permease [Planctomycetota bacterium]|nr:ABC transporter permease [Planctomycetota bacterium]
MPEYRQVLANLIARDLKVKYQSKSLGFAWSLIAPAIMIGILYAVFSRGLRIEMPDYWAFLLAGILPFQFFQESIVGGAAAIRGSAGLIRKIYVPMEILVIAAVTVRAIEFVLQMIVAVLVLVVLHRGGQMLHPQPGGAHAPPAAAMVPLKIDLFKAAIVLPGAIAVTYMFVLGVAMPLAAWSVIYRDIDHIITIVMRILFYATPVFWPLWLFPWPRLMALNPAADLIALYRGPLYFGTWPFNEATGGGPLTAWGIAILIAVVALVVGYALFDRSKRILAEVV